MTSEEEMKAIAEAAKKKDEEKKKQEEEQKKLEEQKKDEESKSKSGEPSGEQKKQETEKKEETRPAPSTSDDDVAFIKEKFTKELIDSLDVETLKKFIAECEGKTLKEKAAWVEKNKKAPELDPSKALPKGPPGGKALGPYDPGYKHVYTTNPLYKP